MDKPVYIVDGARTPFLKAREVGPFSASDLAVCAGNALLSRQSFSPEAIDEVIMGCVMPSEDEANIGRLVALRLGCGQSTPGWTVQRNCASGMQSIDSAMKDIQLGRHHLILAGGTEAMSRAPLLVRPAMIKWLMRFRTAKTTLAKIALLSQLKLRYFSPIIALLRGLRDPLYGLNMGQTAEILAEKFQISRQDMDAFAQQSHLRAVSAKDNDLLSEIITLYDRDGHYYEDDTGVRSDSSLEKLARLKPFFDKRFGCVTAGNSSQVSDGAAMLLLASQEAVDQYQLKVMGRIIDIEWAALNPEVMGLGPVMAATPILQRHGYQLADIDYWEINEAFAAQVIACLRAWQSDDFCREHLNLEGALGSIDESCLNVDGGAIALGHPVGASGARIVLHLLQVLKQKNARRGMASICIGGGQGGAMLLEVEG
jgi:acetyl-CoA C-acetyltransferase